MGAALAVMLAAALPAPARAASVELVATRDNTLFEDADGDTSSGSGAGLYAGRTAQGRVRRALLRFDVAGALPPGAVVDSARLVLQTSSTSDPLARGMSLHRVLADWGEGTSASAGGTGAPAQPGDATWLHTFFPNAFWASAGGDFAPAPSATALVGGAGTWAWSSAALAADVQAWLDGTLVEHGWALLGDESVPLTARRFDARESLTPEWRPRLVVAYTAPPAAAGRAGPAALRLAGPAPNPAVGRVTLAWRAPAGLPADLTVLDVQGRRVRRLARGERAGAGTGVWDGRDDAGVPVAPGLYVVRLEAGARALTRTLLRLR
jgi:hypothetical protein